MDVATTRRIDFGNTEWARYMGRSLEVPAKGFPSVLHHSDFCRLKGRPPADGLDPRLLLLTFV